MPIRAVLFDWGGTLALCPPEVPFEAFAQVAHYARRKLFLALRDQVFALSWQEATAHVPAGESVTVEALVNAAFERLGWSLERSDIEECARLFFKEATTADSVYEDARALLTSLKYRGYRVGVVTNAIFPGAMYRAVVAEVGLSGILDAFVTSADVTHPKPAPDAYVRALSEIGVDLHEALFVGDSLEIDVAGARVAGLRAVLLDRLGRHREGAGYLVIERLAALNQLLDESSLA